MIEIKHVITDVDGSLTDGGVYYFNNGNRARKFSTFDGEGITNLLANDVEVTLLTASSAQEVFDRARWLGVRLYAGVSNKAQFLEDDYGEELGNTVAYFGNDINDIKAMRLAAFVGCPADAHDRIVSTCYLRTHYTNYMRETFPISGYVCERKGGQGAFREFADMLIDNDFKFRSMRELRFYS